MKIRIGVTIIFLITVIFLLFKLNDFTKFEENKVYIDSSECGDIQNTKEKFLSRKEVIKKGEKVIKNGFKIDFKEEGLNEKVILRDIDFTPVWSVEWYDDIKKEKFYVDIDINSGEVISACILKDYELNLNIKSMSRDEIYSCLKDLLISLNLDMDKEEFKLEFTDDEYAVVTYQKNEKYYEFHIDLRSRMPISFYSRYLK